MTIGRARTLRTVEGWQSVQATSVRTQVQAPDPETGDKLPIRDLEAMVISSDGAVVDRPLVGAGQENRSCKDAEHYPADQTENLRSLGTLITLES